MLIRRVVGRSMVPGLEPGNIVIAARHKTLRLDDVVVARMNGREVIKRVTRIKPDGRLFLQGDNAQASTDSRSLGLVDKSDILGVSIMKLKFAKATPPPQLVRKDLGWLPYLLAALTAVMLLAQLLTFDKFVPTLGTYFLPGGEVTAKIVAAALVISELFALPFWLRMDLSPLFRLKSLLCGLFFAALWTLLTIWTFTQNITVDNSGIAGNLVVVPQGWGMIIGELIFLGATVLAAYILNARNVLKIRR